jgi:GT2 family glycosyltransferase
LRLSLVIPTVGRPEVLHDTLESLAGCDPLPDEVVIVDDPRRSAEAVAKAFSARVPALELCYAAERRGASVQRNIGLRMCSGEVVVFADDDVRFQPDLFAVLADVYRDSAVVGATGRIRQEWRAFGNERSLIRRLLSGRRRQGTMTDFGYPRRIQDTDSFHDVEFMQGCLMSARRELAQRVGFDEDLGPPDNYARLEDEDFSYRLSRLGRVRYVPEAAVQHLNLGFRSRDSRYFSWLMVVDRAYLFRKNFRRTPLARAKFALLVATMAVHRALNREWSGVVGVVDGAIDAWREGRSSRNGVPGSRLVAPRRTARGARQEPQLASSDGDDEGG